MFGVGVRGGGSGRGCVGLWVWVWTLCLCRSLSVGCGLYALFAEVDWTCVAGLRLSDRRVVLMRQE